MRRRMVSILLTGVMMAGLLIGCANETNVAKESGVKETTSQVDKSEEAQEVQEQELEYCELDWYVSANGKDAEMIAEAVQEYVLEKINCKVNCHILTGSDYSEIVPNKIMAGENIDIIRVGGNTPYDTLVEMEALYPIDTIWDEYGPNIEGLFNSGVWDSITRDGHVYAVPALKDNAYVIGYIYNDTLASELGLDMDLDTLGWNSFMDIEEFAMKALKLRNEKYPEYADMPLVGSLNYDNPFFFAFEKLAAGTSFAVCNVPGLEVEPQYGIDTVFNFYETDAFREMCLMKQRLVEAGVLAYDYSVFETSIETEPSTLFSATWGSFWVSDDVYGPWTSKLELFDSIWTDKDNFINAGMGITSSCENPERAMMFIDLLNSDTELATMLRFGLEGEHWEYDENGKMQLANRNADPKDRGWYDFFGGWFGNCTIVNGPENAIGPDGIVLDIMEEANNEAILAQHMGFSLDASEILNEITACQNVLSEYKFLRYGQVESADQVNELVDEFVAKLKANGVDKIVAETQKQLDAWMANN